MNPINTSSNDPLSGAFTGLDDNRPPARLPLSVTNCQRNPHAIHPSARVEVDGVTYIAWAEHEWQANQTAERLVKLMAEQTRMYAEISNMNADYAALNMDLLLVREERANAQNRIDQLAAIIAAFIDADERVSAKSYDDALNAAKAALGATQK